MRKILAALLVYLSILNYSQGQNPFSGEQDAVENTSSTEKYSEPDVEKYEEYGPAQQSGTVSRATLCPDGSDQSLDCDCDGTPDTLDEDDCNPANPADPIPIDDYLPMLITTALGIIIYTTQKKKKLLS